MVKILCIQHLAVEGPDAIETWARQKSHSFKKIIMEKGDKFPSIKSFDWLVIMGGPMGVYDEKEFPWLVKEKKFIKKAIKDGKIVLGVCLGAQLIAEVLGGRVYKNKFSEIGFHPIEFTEQGKLFFYSPSPLRGEGLRERVRTLMFHWHNDTFDLPAKTTLLASSKVTKNQAFIWGNKVVGLQFHPEVFFKTILNWTKEFDVKPGPYVQTPSKIRTQKNQIKKAHQFLFSILDQMSGK